MELRHLRYFRAVANALSFSRAAEELHVAQPALSRQIKALEDELGTTLLDRNRQRVLLTDAGRTFLAHTERVLGHLDIAIDAVRTTASGRGGELIIASNWRISLGFVPDVTAEFHQLFPQAEVTVRDLPVHEHLTALRARRIHLGFVPREFLGRNSPFSSMPVLNSEIIAVVPAKHRLAARKAVRLAELADETWIILDLPGGSYRKGVAQICRVAGFSPIFGRGSNSFEGIVSLIAAGQGICLLPQVVLPAPNRSLRYLRTDCAPFELCAVWRTGNDSPLLRGFRKILEEHLRSNGLSADPPRRA